MLSTASESNADVHTATLQSHLDNLKYHGSSYPYKRVLGGVWFDLDTAIKVTRILKEYPELIDQINTFGQAIIHYEELLKNDDRIFEMRDNLKKLYQNR